MLFSFQIGIENDIHWEWSARQSVFMFKESVKQQQVRRAIDRN